MNTKINSSLAHDRREICFLGRVHSIGTLVLFVLLLAGCATPMARLDPAESAIRTVLEKQVREWNAGNLAGFMEGYAKSDKTRFASGGDVSMGWQTVFDRYAKKYGDRATMGVLTFSEVEVKLLSPEMAVAFGRWQLKREKDAPSGLFTLLFKKLPEGWRVIYDHTSSASPN